MDELIPLLRQLYKNDYERILKEISSYRDLLTLQQKPLPDLDWYKNINLYFIYPDSVKSYKESHFIKLIDHLPRIKDLGCSAVHVLPFLKSPMVDKGFDVSDFYTVRKDLGTLNDVKVFMKRAKETGVKVFMDLICNHVSDQHEWFQKAQNGDEQYRNYFIHQKTKPEFIRKFHKESAVWAEYVINGKKRAVNIAFPESAGPIPHWREGKDSYWYYHTYYPEQLDLDWHNPNVFMEFAKIAMYWGNLGFNFRLDAIPFVGKSAYKEVDNNTTFTRNLLAVMNMIVTSIDREAVLIVETYEKERTIIDYFGDTNHKEAKLAYNFHLCTLLWVSLIEGKVDHVWKEMKRLEPIPVHADWINFLRNHDELSLAYLDKSHLKRVKRVLMPNGEPFREGYGISGRTYSLLDNDEKRFISAYIYLASLPGGMLIPYGDEVGKTNIPFADLSDREKEDTRNINRGALTQEELESPKGKRITKKLKELLEKRKVLQQYENIWPERIKAPNGVFAALYRSGSSQLVLLNNISKKRHIVKLNTQEFKTIYKHEQSAIRPHSVILEPFASLWLQK